MVGARAGAVPVQLHAFARAEQPRARGRRAGSPNRACTSGTWRIHQRPAYGSCKNDGPVPVNASHSPGWAGRAAFGNEELLMRRLSWRQGRARACSAVERLLDQTAEGRVVDLRQRPATTRAKVGVRS